jgi:beta-lactamase superfamily II metal-dependent hydrolase
MPPLPHPAPRKYYIQDMTNSKTNRPRRLVAAILAVLALALGLCAAPLSSKEIRVHFINVGQADAILIQSATNAVLIDAGDRKTQDTVINYLREAGIKTLDYVIATHPHADHIGGMAAVIKLFRIKNVVMSDVFHTTATFDKLLTAIEKKGLKITMPNPGDKLTAGIINLTVLAPTRKFDDMNDMSIVVRMTHDETAILFAGDAEAASEREMLKSGRTLRADVLKAGHHGSRSSTTPAFLDAVNPSIVIVSCGRENSYKHPHPQFLATVGQPNRNITLLRTDEAGTIILKSDGQKISRLGLESRNALDN